MPDDVVSRLSAQCGWIERCNFGTMESAMEAVQQDMHLAIIEIERLRAAAPSVAPEPSPAERSKALEPGTPIVFGEQLQRRELSHRLPDDDGWSTILGLMLFDSDYGRLWLPLDVAIQRAFGERVPTPEQPGDET